jgi:hypothetical protein
MDFPRTFALLGRALGVASIGFLASAGALGCSSDASAQGNTSSQSAASTSTSATADGAAPADLSACLTTFAQCVRAGTDDKTCGEALHECLRPPPPADKGDGGCDRGPGDPDHDRGDGGPPPPAPPHGDDDGDAGDRPPPPRDGHPPPPPPDADGGAPEGPRACFDALVTCAKGTDAIDSCVTTATTCLEAFPPPPPPPHH